MIRSPVIPALMSCVFAVALSAQALAQPADKPAPASGEKAARRPVCIYNSRAYSDGAFVCVQKSLMLKCAADDAKTTWTAVTDKELSDKCLAPAARGTVYQQRSRWHRQNIRREITSPG